MNRDQVIDLLRAADPTSENSSASDGFPSMAALLDRIDERSTNVHTQKQTQVVTTPPPPAGRRKWLNAAVSGAIVAVVAIVFVVVALGGTDDEPTDVTTTSTTVPEPTALSPLEVGEALNQAFLDGDWEAERALFAADATYDVIIFGSLQPTGGPMSQLAIGESYNNRFDWDGDGTYSNFDREAGILMGNYVAGVEEPLGCTQADATTVVCDLLMVGNPFDEAAQSSHSKSYTVVDGRITNLTYEFRSGNPRRANEVKIEYQDWVRAERPELNVDDALFASLGTPLVIPDTVETHRQLIAEWKAQR